MIIASLYLETPDIIEEAAETSWDKGEHVLSGVTLFVSTLSIRSDIFGYTFGK